jgi:hypothetical protein
LLKLNDEDGLQEVSRHTSAVNLNGHSESVVISDSDSSLDGNDGSHWTTLQDAAPSNPIGLSVNPGANSVDSTMTGTPISNEEESRTEHRRVQFSFPPERSRSQSESEWQ